MVVFLPMFAGVAVLGVVATTDQTADQAGPQVNPGVARGHAPFADVGLGLGDRLEAPEMETGSCRHGDAIDSDQPARDAAALMARATNTGSIWRR